MEISAAAYHNQQEFDPSLFVLAFHVNNTSALFALRIYLLHMLTLY
jgi:hypothetical protein